MSIILCIETSTNVCSVALSRDAECLLELNNFETNAHASSLHPMVNRLLEETGFSLNNLDAIAISMGPGSYTGLRVGVSAAKGYAYTLNIPLISVNSLAAMAHRFLLQHPQTEGLLAPMTDARRMEVYTAIYDLDVKDIMQTQAMILEPDSFSEYLSQQKLHFMGTGCVKFSEILLHPNASFYPEFHPGAAGICNPANTKFMGHQFENVAYFEPYYLKEFVGTTPKRKG